MHCSLIRRRRGVSAVRTARNRIYDSERNDSANNDNDKDDGVIGHRAPLVFRHRIYLINVTMTICDVISFSEPNSYFDAQLTS